MAIISKQTQVTQEPEKPNIPYPKLMKSKVSPTVVLFTEEHIGIVLISGLFNVGHFSDDWNMGQFKDYEGELSLTLQNKLESE